MFTLWELAHYHIKKVENVGLKESVKKKCASHVGKSTCPRSRLTLVLLWEGMNFLEQSLNRSGRSAGYVHALQGLWAENCLWS